MKKNIDKYGLCIEEYFENKNNAQVYYNRAIGKSPKWKFQSPWQK